MKLPAEAVRPQCEASVDLTISIVNDNNRELLRDCLCSIYEYAGKLSFEVYVVDNASSDNSPEIVRQEFPQVCCQRSKSVPLCDKF